LRLSLKNRSRAIILPGLLVLLLGPAASPARALPPDARMEVYDLRHYTHPNFTRIVVDVSGLREYTYDELHSPDRISINIYQAKLNPILVGAVITPNCDYLGRVRIAQRDAITVRLVVDLSFDRIQSYRVYYLPDPFRIVLDIYPKGATDVPPTATAPGKAKSAPTPAVEAAPARPPEPTLSGQYTVARQLGLDARTIVIDPGHGGTDPGCLGLAGQKEKDIVLDISLRLKKLLTDAGLNAVLTRETDIFIKVENRNILANNLHADLFVSIHANASFNRQRAGVETYFLNLSPDPSVIEVAARENATSTETLSHIKDILEKIIIKNNKAPESRDLAQKIQKNLVQYLSKTYGGVKDLGAKGGPFWVLIGSSVPSVLVEVSHLSNSAEEARLKNETYRQRIAEGIARGILAYRQSLGKGKGTE
jgi:N-acetylmuramoyl-L-alanine amidase